jgi:hypothetical protein
MVVQKPSRAPARLTTSTSICAVVPFTSQARTESLQTLRQFAAALAAQTD